MSTPLLTPERIAALHDAAKRRAQELRRDAIADLDARVVAAFAAAFRRVAAAFSTNKKGVPRGTPWVSKRGNAA